MGPRLQSTLLVLFALVCGVLGGLRAMGSSKAQTEPANLQTPAATGVVQAVENHGWVSVEAGEEPLFALIAAGLYRRSIPDIDQLMLPIAERSSAVPVDSAERRRIHEFVRAFSWVLVGLTVFFAVLAALELVVRPVGLTGLGDLAKTAVHPVDHWGVRMLIAACVAGCTAFFPLLGYVVDRSESIPIVLVSVLVTFALWLTVRALRDEHLAQPFRSAVRGALVGVAVGAAVGTWAPSMWMVFGLQTALAVRVFRTYRDSGGKVRSARGLPVFVTSLHKTALLVLLPVTIEASGASASPWSPAVISWFQMGELCVGWLLFAPFAIMPRGASTSPLAALAPSALLGLGLLFATGVMPQAVDAVGGALQSESAGDSLRTHRVLVAVTAAILAALLVAAARREPRALIPCGLLLVAAAAATFSVDFALICGSLIAVSLVTIGPLLDAHSTVEDVVQEGAPRR